MQFLIDAQLPPTLAHWITSQGHQAAAVRDLGLRDSPDSAIWNHARSADAIIVTKDEDFAQLAAVRPPPPRVLWIRLGNTTNANLVKVLEANWPDLIAHFESGAPVVEVR
jgi:predicted nuclease of predicted toxin-antitoxin system